MQKGLPLDRMGLLLGLVLGGGWIFGESGHRAPRAARAVDVCGTAWPRRCPSRWCFRRASCRSSTPRPPASTRRPPSRSRSSASRAPCRTPCLSADRAAAAAGWASRTARACCATPSRASTARAASRATAPMVAARRARTLRPAPQGPRPPAAPSRRSTT